MKHNKLGKPQPTTLNLKPKQELDSSAKSSKSSIIVECRKCISNKPSSEGTNKKRDIKKEIRGVDETLEKKKKSDGSSVDEKGIRKKRNQESVVRKGSLRNSSSSTKSTDTKHEYGGNELSSHDAPELKVEKKESMKKKQGVEGFLKRMKQNSPKERVEEEEDDDDNNDDDTVSSEEESKESKIEKNKKRASRKRPEGRREDRVTRSSTGGGRGGGGSHETRKSKRGVGRPPKKPDSVVGSNGKRGRDNNGGLEVGSGGRSRKRLRR